MVDKSGSKEYPVEFYRKRDKIYPRAVSGYFARLRLTGVVVLLGIFYGLPWLRWDGHQAVLFDLPARKFHIFGLTLWPQDFFYLAALLIVCALSLFFFTAIAGRLWCGFACPQTVWTEVFLWIERLIEGSRSQQIKLDKSPNSLRKFRIKASKHAVWLLFSLHTGITFVGYFTPLEVLTQSILGFQLGPWETFWIFFYGFATYGNAGWMREQVCLYMCPYARFQSAMFDQNTLIISYDEKRGEARGSRKRGVERAQHKLGDCVDCTLCVQVCPTGIDIRDGLQYECIGCAACIDVCDDVMKKMDYPKGLIRYTTGNASAGSAVRVIRPRTIIYALLLLAIVGGLLYSIIQRVPLELDIIRDRNALYRELDSGMVENIYSLRVLNMDTRAHIYTLSFEGPDKMTMIGSTEVRAGAGEVITTVVRLQIDPYFLQQTSSELFFTISADSAEAMQRTEVARFIGPSNK